MFIKDIPVVALCLVAILKGLFHAGKEAVKERGGGYCRLDYLMHEGRTFGLKGVEGAHSVADGAVRTLLKFGMPSQKTCLLLRIAWGVTFPGGFAPLDTLGGTGFGTDLAALTELVHAGIYRLAGG